jgi:hypothetical protein
MQVPAHNPRCGLDGYRPNNGGRPMRQHMEQRRKVSIERPSLRAVADARSLSDHAQMT